MLWHVTLSNAGTPGKSCDPMESFLSGDAVNHAASRVMNGGNAAAASSAPPGYSLACHGKRHMLSSASRLSEGDIQHPSDSDHPMQATSA